MPCNNDEGKKKRDKLKMNKENNDKNKTESKKQVEDTRMIRMK